MTGIWPTWTGLPLIALTSYTQMQVGVSSSTSNGTSMEKEASSKCNTCVVPGRLIYGLPA